jgi:hypothetical protein
MLIPISRRPRYWLSINPFLDELDQRGLGGAAASAGMVISGSGVVNATGETTADQSM